MSKEHLIPLEKGTERTRRISAMGGEANRLRVEREKAEKADLKFIAERCGRMLLMQLSEAECINAEEVKSFEKAMKKKGDVLDQILKLLLKRALDGDKRAFSQLLELMSNAEEVKKDKDNNDLMKALAKSVGDWANE